MRKSFDSLSGFIEHALNIDLRSGQVFLFVNKKRDRVKALHWNGSSFMLYYKRLERGTFEVLRYDSKAVLGIKWTMHVW